MSGLPAASREALIEASHITCAYENGPAVLDDVSISLAEDDFVGIVGPSGSGKSTLLHALLGSVRPRTGRVERRPDLRIGYVPQVETVNWQFPVTVGECVLMARTSGRHACLSHRNHGRLLVC